MEKELLDVPSVQTTDLVLNYSPRVVSNVEPKEGFHITHWILDIATFKNKVGATKLTAGIQYNKKDPITKALTGEKGYFIDILDDKGDSSHMKINYSKPLLEAKNYYDFSIAYRTNENGECYLLAVQTPNASDSTRKDL